MRLSCRLSAHSKELTKTGSCGGGGGNRTRVRSLWLRDPEPARPAAIRSGAGAQRRASMWAAASSAGSSQSRTQEAASTGHGASAGRTTPARVRAPRRISENPNRPDRRGRKRAARGPEPPHHRGLRFGVAWGLAQNAAESRDSSPAPRGSPERRVEAKTSWRRE